MATNTGHSARSAQRQTRQELEAFLRAPPPLIDAALLSSEERKGIELKVRGTLINQRHQYWTNLGSEKLFTNSGKGSCQPKGVSENYEIGRKPPKEPKQPRNYPRRVSHMDEIRDFVGDRHYERWLQEAGSARFCGKRADEMTREELLVAFSWVVQSRHFWRELAAPGRLAYLGRAWAVSLPPELV